MSVVRMLVKGLKERLDTFLEVYQAVRNKKREVSTTSTADGITVGWGRVSFTVHTHLSAHPFSLTIQLKSSSVITHFTADFRAIGGLEGYSVNANDPQGGFTRYLIDKVKNH